MIEIKGLSKRYGELVVFEDFHLKIPEEEITCIIGPSGSGKSTLLNIVSGLTPYEKGEIYGISDKKISYIFQDTRLLPWSTSLENIMFVLTSIFSQKEARDIALEYLDLVGLSNYSDFYPDELSGGMKQRVAIARAFAYPSELLLMDEPFKALDFELKYNLIDAFLGIWNQNKRTVLFVTHDIEDTKRLGHNIIKVPVENACKDSKL